jgi:hypothetical protein
LTNYKQFTRKCKLNLRGKVMKKSEMQETSITGIHFFKSIDIRSVKDSLSKEDIDDVRNQIRTIKENLDDFINILHGGMLFLRNGRLSGGGVSFAAFRVETLSLIFEYAKKYIDKAGRGEELYKEFLGDLGHEVGFTYGRELLRNLRKTQLVPWDDLSLIELWALFENETGAGVTTVREKDANTFEIILKNNPIGHFYTENGSHSHCYFYSEYYRAILNEFLTTRPRLARDFMPKLMPDISKIVEVKESPGRNRCVFEAILREEKLTKTFDLLHTSLIDMDDEKYGDAINAAREALIESQKEKLFPSSREVPSNIYKTFQNLLPKRVFKLMDENYQKASSYIHRTKRREPRKIREIIRNLRYCIHEIERLEIDEKKLNELKDSLFQDAKK